MNKAAQARTRPRLEVGRRAPFTPASLRELLKNETTAKTLQDDDPGLAEAARELNELQTWVKLNEEWKPSKDLREKLAGALRTVLEITPVLYGEVAAANRYASEEADVGGMRETVDAARLLRHLDSVAERVGECRMLMDPFARHNLTPRWKRYSDDLMGLCKKHLPALSQEACYRLIVATVRSITGEDTTFAAVKTHLTKRRMPTGANS